MMISIIVCVYNTEKYLNDCLKSICNQKYKDFEVIVVDDGSTDSSKNIISSFINEDKRFKYYYQENSGQAIARNNGISKAKGEYIVFVDSDDIIGEDYLTNLSKAIELECDLGFSNLVRKYERKPSLLTKSFQYIQIPSNKENISVNEGIVGIMPSPCAKIIKRDFLIKNNILFYPGKLYEDLYFTQNILLNNPKMMFIDDCSYKYIVHNRSSMTGNGERAFEMFDIFDSILDLANEKEKLKEYREEYEYLAFYHIAIGTLYRYYNYKKTKFFYALSKCREYLKKHNFTLNNKYIKNMPFFEKLFLYIFYSFNV